MAHDHGEDKVGLDVEPQQLADLECSDSNGGLLVEKVPIHNFLEDGLGVRLDLVLDAEDQIIQLGETCLFEVDLK